MPADETRLRVESEGVTIEFEPRTGEFSVSNIEGPVFERARARVILRTGSGTEVLEAAGVWEAVLHEHSELVAEADSAKGRLFFRARASETEVILEAGLRWDGEGDTPGIEAVSPLSVARGGIWPARGNNRSWRFYQNGWQCWTPSGTLGRRRPGDYLFPLFLPRAAKAMLANTSTPVTSQRGHFTSEWFAGLADVDGGESVVVGFTGVGRALSQVSAVIGGRHNEARLEAVSSFEGKSAVRDEEFFSEPLAVIPGDLTGGNLERYAELVAAEQGVEGVREGPVGWCSWYQYFCGVTREKVERNLEMASSRYGHFGIELVQVDDGYQPAVGDWLETNDDFPGSMKELADEITARGKIPGIWVAPFTAVRGSRLFKENRGWLLSNDRGKPLLAGLNPMWGGRFYGLDITNPETLEWVRTVFEGVRASGYRFVKLDFMATAMLEGKRFDASLTRVEALRRALQVIRDALGPETYVIAAGGPILAGTGILDAQRVSGDVAPSWRPFYQKLIRDRATQGVRNGLVSVFTRYFLSNRLFEGDPDCLMVRTKDTRLTLDERRTLASAISIFGGSMMVSDDLGLWGPEEELMMSRVMPHLKGKPYVPDIWTSEVPRFMVSELEDASGAYHAALVVNWANSKKTLNVSLSELGVEPGRYHAYEFWTGRYLGEVVDVFKLVQVPAHGCALVKLTPSSGSARLVGSNIHLMQGAAELSRFEQTPVGVRMVLDGPVKRQARLAVSLPRQALVESVSNRSGWTDAPRLSRVSRTVYSLDVELDGKTEVELVWPPDSMFKT